MKALDKLFWRNSVPSGLAFCDKNRRTCSILVGRYSREPRTENVVACKPYSLENCPQYTWRIFVRNP
jgi:hypothetical protein